MSGVMSRSGAADARHYNRNMGLKTWKWTDWPLMVLSVVFLVVYSWKFSRTHIALCETVINVIWVVFVSSIMWSRCGFGDDRWR